MSDHYTEEKPETLTCRDCGKVGPDCDWSADRVSASADGRPRCAACHAEHVRVSAADAQLDGAGVRADDECACGRGPHAGSVALGWDPAANGGAGGHYYEWRCSDCIAEFEAGE